MANINHKKSVGWELVRFLICGAFCALADYLICQLIVLLFPSSFSKIWITVISTTGGFIVGVILNYLISTFWVYQNVENEKKTKTVKFIIWFVILSAIGLAISIGAMLLCDLFVVNVLKQESIVELSVMSLIKEHGWKFLLKSIFWTYFVSFCIKTLVGLVWNYFTRKYILYKAPKEEKRDLKE